MLSLLEMSFPNMDPMLLPIWGSIGLRWYGLGYLVAFLFTLAMLRLLQKGGYLRMGKDDCLSFILWAIIGTLAGGRLGYLAFYSDYFWSGAVLSHPGYIIGISSGGFSGGLSGLSFHGGLIGVVVAGALFTWTRIKRQWRQLDPKIREEEGRKGLLQRYRALCCNIFDASVHGVPLGIAAVRMGNFINGELYGRVVEYDLSALSDDPELTKHVAERIANSPELRATLADAFAANPDLLTQSGVTESAASFADKPFETQMLLASTQDLAESLNDPSLLDALFAKSQGLADALQSAGVNAAQFAPDWAMRFPTTPEAREAFEQFFIQSYGPDGSYVLTQQGEAWLNQHVAQGLSGDELVQAKASLIAEARHLPVDPELWSKLSESLPLRHPSQIYQALGEGMAVLVLIWLLRWKFPKKGMAGGLFLLAYGLLRIPAELFRQPDPQFSEGQEMSGWGAFLDSIAMTQGQLLSLAMALIGGAMIFLCWRSKNPFMQIDGDALRFKGTPMSEVESGNPEALREANKTDDASDKKADGEGQAESANKQSNSD